MPHLAMLESEQAIVLSLQLVWDTRDKVCIEQGQVCYHPNYRLG
jgi:hypothetical protein